MSGGSLNYFYGYLEEHIGDFGDRELDDLVRDLAKLFHDREWYLSADTGVGEWNEARDAFKAKWFTQHGREERIDKYLDDLGDEIRMSLGIWRDYCQSCKYWEKEEKSDYYGKCKLVNGCLMHRSETCNKYEEKKDD